MSAKIPGLASGFDTQGIVDSLMSIEKIPLEKLDIKKQTEQVRLQAYQAVNTYLLKFRTSMNSLSSKKLWNANACVSTNEKSITATANEYAVKGTYNFRVAQLATAAQYQTKTFTSKSAPLVKRADTSKPAENLGSINLASGKTRVDNSAKLENLNGGKGVFRGSIRVTDGTGGSTIIDLSACDTMDDVVRTLNAGGSQINAFVNDDGRLCVQDVSNGTGDVRIQNVGTGTTASDLGIAGTAVDTSAETGKSLFIGDNAYTLGSEMNLKHLNDGLGVDTAGVIQFDMTDEDGKLRQLLISVEDCDTVGDVVKRLNDALDGERKRTDINGDMIDPDKLKDLRFAISEDKTSFTLIGSHKNMTYKLGNMEGRATAGNPAADLGMGGTFTSGTSGGDVKFDRVLGGVNSPMLKTLGGATGSGVGSVVDPESTTGKVRLPFNGNTLVSTLNGGQGIDTSRPLQIITYEGGVEEGKRTLYSKVIDPQRLESFLASGGTDKTVNEVLTWMNDEVAAFAANPANEAAGLVGLKFSFDETYGGIAIEGAQAGYGYDIAGTLAYPLGLQRVKENGTTVGLDPENYTADADLQKEIDKFYGKGYSGLLDDNGTIDSDTVMGDLLKLAGLDKDDYADNDAWAAASLAKINTMFTDPTAQFDISVDKGDGTMLTVSMKWADVAAKLGSTLDGDTKVDDFMDAMNGVIKDKFVAGNIKDVNGDAIHPPKVSINKYDNGFMWTGVDLSRDWKMDGFGSFNLDRDTADITAVGSLIQEKDIIVGAAPSPMTDGYYVAETLDKNTLLARLNTMNGLGIVADQELVIGFGSIGSISISTNDIITKLKALPDSPPADMEDYLNILNNLASTALNAPSGINDGNANPISFTFDVVDGGIGITNIQNTTELSISGTAAGSPTIFGTSSVGFTAVDKTGLSNGDSISGLGKLNPYHYEENTVAGMGQIALSIGTNDEVIYLNTDLLNGKPLNGNSTLKELIAKLNDELNELATNAARQAEYVPAKYSLADLEALKDVRFTLNSTGTGIAVDNGMKKAITFHDTVDASGNSDNQTLGQDLGLVNADDSSNRVEAQSFDNMGSLNRQIIGRATPLSQFLGENPTMGSFRLTDSTGKTMTIGLDNCKTVGDIIDAINSGLDSGFGMEARINAKGDGIEVVEGWKTGVPPASERTGNIKIEDLNGGSTAKKLGIAGSGEREKEGSPGKIDGTTSSVIEVREDDTLESLMYRIAETGNYKCSIVNSGTASNPQYRLSVAATNSGEESDFVISCDVDQLGFTQTSRGKDAKVLYGDPSSNSSPILLSSSTNSNSNALMGITLDCKQVTSDWTTITINTDKEKAVEEMKGMVTAYNDMLNIMSQLDAYDEESGEKGILFGDANVRSLMDTINDFFYQVFNPHNVGSKDKVDGKQAVWSWMDAGFTLTSASTGKNGSGTWFTTLDLDEEKLTEMVASNWDTLAEMMSGERNASNRNLSENSKPIVNFNGELEEDCDIENAINGNINKVGFGTTNGIVAKDTIANGSNSYTITFQQPITVNRLSIYHESSENALKDFLVEYLDPKTGKWEKMRTIEGNKTDQNHLGFADYPTVGAIRITASSTNAKDDKFRLLDVQVYEQTGLAAKLNQAVNKLSDTTSGFLASRTEEIDETVADIDEQMSRLQDRLTSKEESLWRKFTAMETALAQLQNQGSYLNSMVGSMGSKSS